MQTLDQVITAALADEAEYAPTADELLTRLFDPQAPAPTRQATGPGRLVPVGLAAAVALIVSGGVWWTSHHTALEPTKTPKHGPTAPVTTGSAQSEHQGRLPGLLDLSAGSVHLELETSQDDWRGNWTLNCPDSLLAGLQLGDVACAGPEGELPRYEATVSSGDGTMPVQSETIQYLSKVKNTYYAAVGSELAIGGHPSWARSARAKVRYDCGDGCSRWVDRTILIVWFPGRGRQVTLVAPTAGVVEWLSNYVYVEPDS